MTSANPRSARRTPRCPTSVVARHWRELHSLELRTDHGPQYTGADCDLGGGLRQIQSRRDPRSTAPGAATPTAARAAGY